MKRAAAYWLGPLFLLGFVPSFQCGASEDHETGTARQAILEGGLADVQNAPLLLLYGPEGQCSACLVSPNLIATARHCVAATREGGFSCTPSGDLVLTAEGYGAIGANHPPGSLKFYEAVRQSTAGLSSQTPDAYGAQILSTATATACRDDLAFVVLDRPLSPTPLPVRLAASAAGEGVSLWGFGVTENITDPTALRVRRDTTILAVGPDVATDLTQPAPVRAVRTSPVTCVGDSGGAIVSVTTGELIGVISLGTVTGGPYCANGGFNATVGPRLGAYPDLVNAAFQAARAALPADGSADASALDAGSPTPDSSSGPDIITPDQDALAEGTANPFGDAASPREAAAADAVAAAEDAAPHVDEGTGPVDANMGADGDQPEVNGYLPAGDGGCECALGRHHRRLAHQTAPWWVVFGALLSVARREARRRGK